MNQPGTPSVVAHLVFGTRSLGLAAIGLAAAAGVFCGTELSLAAQTASTVLSEGIGFFWQEVLGLTGLVLDVTAAAIAVLGGGLMCLKRPSGRRFLVAALTAAIVGEVALAFVDAGQYTTTTSAIWIGLLLLGYLVLITSAVLQRRWRPRPTL